jgi:hypothetical protein
MVTILRMWKYEVCGRMERMVLHFEVPKRFMNTIGLANMNTMTPDIIYITVLTN